MSLYHNMQALQQLAGFIWPGFVSKRDLGSGLYRAAVPATKCKNCWVQVCAGANSMPWQADRLQILVAYFWFLPSQTCTDKPEEKALFVFCPDKMVNSDS